MDTYYIYKIKEYLPMLEAHKKHLENELRYLQDKDIEKVLNVELGLVNSILRAMNKTSKRMEKII